MGTKTKRNEPFTATQANPNLKSEAQVYNVAMGNYRSTDTAEKTVQEDSGSEMVIDAGCNVSIFLIPCAMFLLVCPKRGHRVTFCRLAGWNQSTDQG